VASGQSGRWALTTGHYAFQPTNPALDTQGFSLH